MSDRPIDLRLGAAPPSGDGLPWFAFICFWLAVPILAVTGHIVAAVILGIPLLLGTAIFVWACIMCGVLRVLDWLAPEHGGPEHSAFRGMTREERFDWAARHSR